MIRKVNNCGCCDPQAQNLSGALSNWTEKDIKKIIRKTVQDEMGNKYTAPEQIGDYLYKISYETYNYEDGYKYMQKFKPTIGMCSAFRKGKWVGRNFDWLYDEFPNFVVETKAVNNRYATLGVAFATEKLTKQFVDSGEPSEFYNYLPFGMVDIINEKGLYISTNVVTPGDKGKTTGTKEGAQEMCAIMLPRYLADYFSTAKEAIQAIYDLNIFSPLGSINEEIHVFICDQNDNYIIEFINNTVKVFSNTDYRYTPIPNGNPIMTNFYIDGWNGEIKTVYSGWSEEETRNTGLTPHAMGLERYQIINGNYPLVETKEDVINTMKDVKYSLLFNEEQNPYWYSEFVGYTQTFGELNIYNTVEDYQLIKQYGFIQWRERQRNGIVWTSRHTSVYDLENLRISVFAEEEYDKEYTFILKVPGKEKESDIEDIIPIIRQEIHDFLDDQGKMAEFVYEDNECLYVFD